MKRHPFLIPMALLLLFALPLAGCEDEDETTTGSVTGSVLREPGSTAVSGADVVLLRTRDLTVAAGPRTTNSTGKYGFTDLEPGRYYVMVFSAPDLILDQSSASLNIEAAKVATHDVRLLDSELWDGAGTQIQGTVVDASTQEPIAGAFASFQFGVDFLLSGATTPLDAVTDDAGSFTFPNAFLLTDEGGGVEGVAPFAVTKEGYLPARIDTLRTASDAPDTTLMVAVELTPIEPGDGHRVSGNIQSPDAEPVAGLQVHLAYLPEGPPVKRKVPMPGYVATTDAAGDFAFENVPPGPYRLEPGASPDDGWAVHPELREDFYVEDADVDRGTLTVFPAIVPLSPAAGAAITGDSVTMTWEPVPGADGYEVFFGFGHILETISVTEPSYTVSLVAAKDVLGIARWLVEAYDDQDAFLGATETVQTWTVEGDPPTEE